MGNKTESRRDPDIHNLVGGLSSRLISMKKAAPGSEHHADALKALMNALASNEGAVDALAAQQGQVVQKENKI